MEDERASEQDGRADPAEESLIVHVATANRGYRDLLSQDEAFLVPPNNHDAFAKAILNLLEDEKLRKTMGLKGRAKALRYSWDNIVRDIADYYEEIVTG